MKIAEVSEQYEISTDTLRYYERVGLIPQIRVEHNARPIQLLGRPIKRRQPCPQRIALCLGVLDDAGRMRRL